MESFYFENLNVALYYYLHIKCFQWQKHGII